jgi:hypothetical protein
MDFDETVMKWRQNKSRSAVRRLDAFCSRRYEYKGKQFGHPSTYALVRFECAPADSLVFEMQACHRLTHGTAQAERAHSFSCQVVRLRPMRSVSKTCPRFSASMCAMASRRIVFGQDVVPVERSAIFQPTVDRVPIEARLFSSHRL